MTYKRFVSLVLLVVLAVLVLQPARAEALEPMTILLIVGAGVVVVALVAVVIISIATEGRPREQATASPREPQRVALKIASGESP